MIGGGVVYTLGVAVDASSNLYIADSQNNRIRKVDSSGMITTVAGNGTGGLGGDGGPATSAQLFVNSVAMDAAGNIYAVSPNMIRKITPNGVIITIANAGGSRYVADGVSALNGGAGFFASNIALDPPGNIYIADFKNNRIRKIDKNGIISTYAGNGTQGFLATAGPLLKL